MDPIEKTIQLFHQGIAARAEHGEALAPQLVDAADLLCDCLVNNGRILLCGYSASALQAQILATSLMSQHKQERPGLPAILLNACVATLTSIGEHYGTNDIFARQIRTLGQTGDVLIIFTTTGDPQSLLNAVQAAHERNIRILCLGGKDGGHLTQLMSNDDLDIQIPVDDEVLIQDMHLQAITILCELIDDQLFGGGT